MRNLASVSLTSIAVVTLAITPMAPLAARSRAPLPSTVIPPDRHSPVRCAALERPNYGANRPHRGRRAVPPPPPMVAPMALPAPSVQESAADAAAGSVVSAPPPVAVGKVMGSTPPYGAPGNTERYGGKDVAPIHAVADAPVSTFSVDVDTGSYANVRRFLTHGQTPPADAVRTEEMINYFRYDYPLPNDRARPFSVTTDVATTPWNANTRLLRIGIRGYDMPASARPASNLVFLIDVSGSMDEPDKLPLVKSSLKLLADRLGPNDRVSMVVYAGAAGVVLDPTNSATYIKQALDCLDAGGSTAGGEGMELAYSIAKANFIKGGVNRVIMATDGDFNVGINSDEGIEAIVKKNREQGITLTTLGFGEGNYNERMMEHIADVGNGNYAYIDSALEAHKVLDEQMAATIFTIAKDVKIQIEFNPAVIAEYRLIGYENRLLAEEDFNNDKVDAGDIGSGHQVTALYEIVPTNSTGWLPERRYPANRAALPDDKPMPAMTEAAWLKLRYKLPDGDQSMLIQQPVAANAIWLAPRPSGDFAFATAVAAYGQKLRGDKYLGAFAWNDIRGLAGVQQGYIRSEFGKLVDLAEGLGKQK